MALQSTTAIATITLQSASPSVTFSGIPSTYRDLIIVGYVRSTRSATDDDLFVSFNSDAGSNYSYVRMVGRSAGASSADNINGTSANDLGQIPAASSASGQFASCVMQVLDYSSTNKHKGTLSRTSAAGSTDVVGSHAGRWASTTAVNTIAIYPRVGSFLEGTTISLYGRIA